MDPLLERGLIISRRLLTQARAELRALDEQPDPELARLEKAFARIDRGGLRITPSELNAKAMDSKIIACGDFSTCPHPRRFLCNLLEEIPPCIVALPAPLAQWQARFDTFLDGHEDPEGLAKETDLAALVPPYAIPHWLALFSAIRTFGHRTVLFEKSAHEPLAQRNKDALNQLVVTYREAGPDERLIILAGELRCAAGGLLPELKKTVGTNRATLVLFDLAQPYLTDISCGGDGQGIYAIGRRRFAVCEQSPLARLQSYLAWYAHDEVPSSGLELAETFSRAAQQIRDAFGLPESSLALPLIINPGDPRIFQLAIAASALSSDEMEHLEACILAGDSRYLPEHNLVYIGNMALSHVSEEASHFVRATLGGPRRAETGEDAFWSIALHELVGYLGSKVIVPDRRPPTVDATSDLTPEELAHLYGYNLGERMWTRFCQSPELVIHISHLFSADLHGPGQAKALYFRSLDMVAGPTSEGD
jgi:hypothetical protein